MPTAQWEWQDDTGAWTSYAHVDNAMLDGKHRAAEYAFSTTKLSFNEGFDSVYMYDLKKMTQKNTASGRVRKLRRIEMGDDDEDSAFVRAMSASGPASAPAPAPAPAPTPAPAPAAAAPAPPPAPVAKTAVAADSATDEDEAETAAPVMKKHKTESGGGGLAKKASSSHHAQPPELSAAIVAAQTALGAQSLRKQKYDLGPVYKDAHGKICFDRMLSREKQLCGEWAVLYHSYSFAALLYEVQAAVAAVLFRFKSEYATLPRLLKEPFLELPDADALMAIFPKFKDRDHNPKFRAVGLSGTSSLLANDSEAPPKNIFLHGYSCSDLSFVGVLENLLVSCGVPVAMKSTMSKDIIALSAKYGLDVSQFKGPKCKSGRAGHMLQIFVKRNLVDKYVYGALPFGVPDKKRPQLSKYLEGDGPIEGQVRIVANPSVFMRGNAVRMYVYSADPTFHGNRPTFQQELTKMLEPVIGCEAVRLKAAEGIYAGKLPPWFHAGEYETQKAKAAAP